jgi:ABC-type phosphate transport system permease subunit
MSALVELGLVLFAVTFVIQVIAHPGAQKRVRDRSGGGL